ncbi:Williams-Beuren syndrome chromosomal region 27 protein [Plakobranchus ocellatus]|uniref:Williams-Beuren syndrome chromosomal region 27 protein n=1 Tax=Plakobranchus ocellatus TaxID=259542 RepID=A0AAV4AQR1_9GAST|nr:Williams-Beuren syndrome chromosomal region 27 protein [Plakobranchus ocellatus]
MGCPFREDFRIAEDESCACNDFAHEAGVPREEITRRYALWAENAKYERDLCEKVYKGPSIAADTVARYFPGDDLRRAAKILDVAAGSGFVGQKLKEKGFYMIDALEPCGKMLQLAQEKGIYRQTFQNYLNGHILEIKADYYDVAVISGGMGEGHIPCKGLNELIRIVRPGGLIVIVMREEYLQTVAEYRDQLEPRMSELEVQGRWKRLARNLHPCYSFHNTGVVFVYRVLEPEL